MVLYENPYYKEDLLKLINVDLPFGNLQNSTILISGASGLIASCFIDCIMLLNEQNALNCQIIALGRDIDKAKNRFSHCWNSEYFTFMSKDINSPLDLKAESVDYVLHLASNTHPVQYANDPIGTITTNIIGLKNMLDFACEANTNRFIFASSNEIYGENRGDAELFDESYCGYIDCNTLRAGYPESKRCGEALCQAYFRQKGLDFVISRFTRSYGPSMLKTDTKAISQFIKNALNGEDIVLKSEGLQYYSYTYVIDAVLGLLYILLKGETGNAYNIADVSSDIRLKDLAALIAGCVGREVIFELPNSVESAGFSKATKARLDGSKIEMLGWKPFYSIEEGIKRTIHIMTFNQEGD